MYDDITQVDQQPAIFWPAFNTRVQLMFVSAFRNGLSQRAQHTVAAAVADDEKIGKRGDLAEIKKKNLFGFFIFENVNQ